jgi:TolB protein
VGDQVMAMRTWSRPALTVILLAVSAAPAFGAKDDAELVSRASGSAGAPGDANSVAASLSRDGRFVAFVSEANNLSADDDDGIRDVYVRDLVLEHTTLVSRTSGPAGPGGNADSGDHSISADGRLVAFESDADNLSAEDNDPVTDVFVRDLAANTTILVSRATGPAGAKGDAPSFSPEISADGRFVAFSSDAQNLSGADNDEAIDVFVRDLASNTTMLVSRASGPAGAGGDSGSSNASMSADGRFVAFASSATNLSAEDTDPLTDVFVRDVVLNVTSLASRAGGPAGPGGDNLSSLPSMSADGRFVAFASAANNLSAADSEGTLDVFVRDLAENTTTLASRAGGPAGPGGDGNSSSPSISADGRFVALDSDADNLSGTDNDAVRNVFVRDIASGTTTLVSRASGAEGAAADGSSAAALVSGDGRFVAFSSEADNVSDADNDGGIIDVFRRDVLGAPAEPATLPTPSPPESRSVDRTAPVISRLSLTNRRFRVVRRGRAAAARRRIPVGTAFRFRLSEPARIAFLIERRAAGRRMAGRCRRPTLRNRTGRRCVRHLTVLRFSRPGQAGRNRVPFSGRLGAGRPRRVLQSGRYRATVAATDAAGNRSRSRHARFEVVSTR